MEQKDLSKTIQHGSGIDQIGSSILQVVLDSDTSTLTNLACQTGKLLVADACIIISITADSERTDDIGYWQKKNFDLVSLSQITQQLSDPIFEGNPGQTEATASRTSSLVDSVEQLLRQLLPSKAWSKTITKFQGRTNGLVLLFKSHSSKWIYSKSDLSEIAKSIAIALAQIQLQQQLQAKTRYQSLLKNLSREISQSSQPRSLFPKCLAEVCTTLQLDRGTILTLKYQNPLKAKRQQQIVKGTVKVACQWTQSENSLSQDDLRFNLSDSDLCQKAWQTAPRCQYFASDKSFPDLTSEPTSDILQPSGSALLMMPLMGKKNRTTEPAVVIGFLVLQHNSVYHWSQDELDLIDWIGVQISTAIIHYQTLNQVQSIVDERTAQLKWSLDFQGKLSDKMRQHIEQLQKLNQLKDDFMNSMSHELKTPLTSMKIAIKMLRQAQISPQMREKYLNILEQEWDREYSLIKDLLTLQQVESGELAYSPQELDLDQTIDNLARTFVSKWQADEIELDTGSRSNLKIYTDADSLEHILNELLLNAGKYSNPDTTIRLTVESQTTPRGKDIVISVTNIGAGITPEELPHIFDKFRRGKGVTDRAVPGTGLGLALVQYLVEHLNGTIEAKSEPLDNDVSTFLTTFVLRLPQQPSVG
ncbi:GAF domain-containing sensor histidine kinase [Pleurocapsales cyanobacterium LEGE 10410]|nr:GAF domain-containing sensor histidine kinase [Pleurocapsales cyanobacterium LEGE 10410]